jgi:hypothetical protein
MCLASGGPAVVSWLGRQQIRCWVVARPWLAVRRRSTTVPRRGSRGGLELPQRAAAGSLP